MSQKKFWIIALSITIISIVISIYQKRKTDALLSIPQSYVIGDIIERRTPTRGDPIIVYIYVFKNIKYKREATIPNYDVKEGDRYFVSVPTGHESEGIFLFNKPVPKNIKHAPDDGWKDIPN